MTPAHIATILVCAVAALIAGFLLIAWLASRAIDDLQTIWTHDHSHRVTHIARCSTAPDLRRWEVAAIVGVILLAGVIALLSSTWLGQELLEYVVRVLLARP